MLRPAVYNIAQYLTDVMPDDYVSSDITCTCTVHNYFRRSSCRKFTDCHIQESCSTSYTNILASNDETSKYPGWSPKSAKSGLYRRPCSVGISRVENIREN